MERGDPITGGSDAGAARGDPAAEHIPVGSVTVEAVAWVNRFVGGDGTSRVVLHEPLEPGDTVRSLLRRLGGRYPLLQQALWDRATGELDEHVNVLLNESFSDPRALLDTEVTPESTITLLAPYMGG